jgi:hypothetical protein
MNRYSMLMFAALAAGSALYAQPASEVKASYTGVKNNLMKMAEKMPADQYGFKAAPEIRSFAAEVAHVVDSQNRTCAAVSGATAPASAASMTTKDDLVAALKASFELCDAAFNSLTDEDGAKMINVGRGQRSKNAVLWGVVSHDNEQYGYMAVYLRIKGIIPPSSEARQ